MPDANRTHSDMDAFQRTLLTHRDISPNIIFRHTFPTRSSVFCDFPPYLHPALLQYCAQDHIQKLYSHQGEALDALFSKKNVVLSTSTSSGKSLVFQLAIYQSLLNNPNATALLLYPTKALANDQMKPFEAMQDFLQENLSPQTQRGKAAIYDGDTPSKDRTAIRNNASIVLTNPDMLHVSLLPHHPVWEEVVCEPAVRGDR